MTNAFDEMRAVLQQAKDIDRAASQNAERMAELLNRNGNLRRLSAYELRLMKKELSNFNMGTGRWKKP